MFHINYTLTFWLQSLFNVSMCWLCLAYHYRRLDQDQRQTQLYRRWKEMKDYKTKVWNYFKKLKLILFGSQRLQRLHIATVVQVLHGHAPPPVLLLTSANDPILDTPVAPTTPVLRKLLAWRLDLLSWGSTNPPKRWYISKNKRECAWEDRKPWRLRLNWKNEAAGGIHNQEGIQILPSYCCWKRKMNEFENITEEEKQEKLYPTDLN